MENTPIGEILGGEPSDAPVEAVEPTQETAEQQASEGRLRDEKGRFAPRETGVETPPEPQASAEPVPPTEQTNQLPKEEYSALKDERRKRQELERRLMAMEQQLRQPPAPQQPPVDFWDDPQGFMAGFGDQLLQQWEQRQQAKRIDTSEAAARAAHDDYDEAIEAFSQAVHANPRLAYELAQADNPGEFAYQRGKTALTLQEVGSIDALETRLRAKWEAEALAAMPAPKTALPSTTAADGSVGGRSGPTWSGPTPLSNILG